MTARSDPCPFPLDAFSGDLCDGMAEALRPQQVLVWWSTSEAYP